MPIPTYQTPINVLIASADPKKEVALRSRISVYLNKPLPAYAPNPALQALEALSAITVGAERLVTTGNPPSTNPVTDMKTSSNALYSDSLTVQAYITTIQQQAIINLVLDNTSINIPSIQTISKQHATDWTGTYFPKLAQSQADIADVCNNFEGFYTRLVAYATAIDDPAQKETIAANVAGFKQGIALLEQLVDGKGDNITAAISALTTFNGNVAGDNGRFQSVMSAANIQYNGTTGELATLQSQIDTFNSEVGDDLTYIGLAATGEVVGGLMIVVGLLAEFETGGLSTALVIAGLGVVGGSTAGMVLAILKLQTDQASYQKLVEELAGDQIYLMVVKTVVDVFTSMVKTSTSAVNSLTNMGGHWSNLSAYYTNLLSDCDTLMSQDPVRLGQYLIAELNTMQSNFADLKLVAQYCVTNATLPLAPSSLSGSLKLSSATSKPLLLSNDNTNVATSRIPINKTIDQEVMNLANGMRTDAPDLQASLSYCSSLLAPNKPFYPSTSTVIAAVETFQFILTPFQNQSTQITQDLDGLRVTSLARQQTLTNQMASIKASIIAAQPSLKQNQAALSSVENQLSNAQNQLNMYEQVITATIGPLIDALVDAIGNWAIEAKGYSQQIWSLSAQINSDQQRFNTLQNQAQAIQTQLTNISTMVSYVTRLEQGVEGLTATFGNLILNLQTADSAPIVWAGAILEGALLNWEDAMHAINQMSPQASVSLVGLTEFAGLPKSKSLNGRINQFLTTGAKNPAKASTNSVALNSMMASSTSVVASTTARPDLLSQPLSNLMRASGELFSTTLLVQLYVQTVLLQPNITIPIIGIDLPAYQTTARNNALAWLGTYYPELLSMQSNLAAFCDKFTNFLPILLQYSENLSQPENLAVIRLGISLLRELLTQYQSDNSIGIEQLQVYSDLINRDYAHYSTAQQAAQVQYTGTDGRLSDLTSALSDLNQQISFTNGEIVAAIFTEGASIGGIVVAMSTFLESGGTSGIIAISAFVGFAGSTLALVLFIQALDALQNQANQLTAEISKDTQALAALVSLTSQLSSFVRTTGSDPIANATSINQAITQLNTNLEKMSEQLQLYTPQELIASLTEAGAAIAQLKITAQQCVSNGYLPVENNTATPPTSTRSIAQNRDRLFQPSAAAGRNMGSQVKESEAAVVGEESPVRGGCCVTH